MSTHKIGFYEDLTKLSLNYHQMSSNTYLISSAALTLCLPVSSADNLGKQFGSRLFLWYS